MFKKILNKISAILLIIIISFNMLGISKLTKEPKIFKNIYIENVDVSNLTKDEAYKKIKSTYFESDITIKYENLSWTIKPGDINLNYNIDKAIDNALLYTKTESRTKNLKRSINLLKNRYDISLYATYNEIYLSDIINKIDNKIRKKVKEATISIDDTLKVTTTKSEDGVEVDVVKLKEIIYDMIDKKNIEDVYLPTKIIKPNINTSDVESIDTVLGQYSTRFNNYTSRGANIGLASKSSSDILIMPNDIYSYNKATGPRTWNNGYKTAKVIVGGKYINGEGGGVCQVSSTIYNASLLAGLDIQEVHNHTYPSRYVQRGRDSSVAYGYIDLKIRNNLSHPIYIKNIVKNGVITSKIYGSKLDKSRIYIKTDEDYGKDKIKVKTYRVFLDEQNNKIKEELIFESEYKTINKKELKFLLIYCLIIINTM